MFWIRYPSNRILITWSLVNQNKNLQKDDVIQVIKSNPFCNQYNFPISKYNWICLIRSSRWSSITYLPIASSQHVPYHSPPLSTSHSTQACALVHPCTIVSNAVRLWVFFSDHILLLANKTFGQCLSKHCLDHDGLENLSQKILPSVLKSGIMCTLQVRLPQHQT